MRCTYCYNPEIVFGKGKLTFTDVLKFLRTRINLLDAVVLSGGECTLHKGLPNFIKEIRSMGLLVKIDTNGSNPDLIQTLVLEGLIDFVSLDFKAPQKKFRLITGAPLYKKFNETLLFLIRFKFPFEVRTTIHSELMTQQDLQEMLYHLNKMNYSGKYYLQNFVAAPETIGQIGSSKLNYLNSAKFDTALEIVIRN